MGTFIQMWNRYFYVRFTAYLLALVLLSFLGVTARMSFLESLMVSIADKHGAVYRLNVQEGKWYYGYTNTIYEFVRVELPDGQQLEGWTIGKDLADYWEPQQLPYNFERQGRVSLQGIAYSIGGDVNARCVYFNYLYSAQKKEYEPQDATQCQLTYPTPTISALKALGIPQKEDLYWGYLHRAKKVEAGSVIFDIVYNLPLIEADFVFTEDGGLEYVFQPWNSCQLIVIDSAGNVRQFPSSQQYSISQQYRDSIFPKVLVDYRHQSVSEITEECRVPLTRTVTKTTEPWLAFQPN